MKKWLLAAGVFALTPAMANTLALQDIELPVGFNIEVFVDDIENARQMAFGDKGMLFVGSRRAGKVYAVTGGGLAGVDMRVPRQVTVVDKGLTMPSGIAFYQGDLYVADISKILKYSNIEKNWPSIPEPTVIYDDLPEDLHHGWKYLRFDEKGRLYIPVGAPCNICDAGPEYSKILRLDVKTGKAEDVALGVRNSVGFDFDPESGDLWFTDNGRDHMGDDIPDCELNHLAEIGQHFGYPYFHAGDVVDPEFGANRKAEDYVFPKVRMGAHVAPLGMTFYTGEQFPADYQRSVFVAEHGSWNRSSKVGYRVREVRLKGNEVVEVNVFAKGWLQGEEAWGRPADVAVAPDGSLLVSDDGANVIYRISYNQ
ncbi:PQQ-dependent sugar dehydrogenase [Paraferrimonas sedimenticola]|uniref:Sorbosone dehydrogenase n=1 Tax=Paraferrimonas sedimenticola TaxID=375674 RepID=A0AA37RTN3_9GAMM|nr:PQQ-dependent sugar dehydrogenase [Paraferrimonas sedimenticola]GLP95431.1 sorbosone dehydrogenase [Paraferrimonas sedimenticola]